MHKKKKMEKKKKHKDEHMKHVGKMDESCPHCHHPMTAKKK